MLVLLLLTLWAPEGGTRTLAKEMPTVEICNKMAKELVQLARKDGFDLSTNCIVVRRPTSI